LSPPSDFGKFEARRPARTGEVAESAVFTALALFDTDFECMLL